MDVVGFIQRLAVSFLVFLARQPFSRAMISMDASMSRNNAQAAGTTESPVRTKAKYMPTPGKCCVARPGWCDVCGFEGKTCVIVSATGDITFTVSNEQLKQVTFVVRGACVWCYQRWLAWASVFPACMAILSPQTDPSEKFILIEYGEGKDVAAWPNP